MSSRYEQEKETIRRYAKSPQGMMTHRKAKQNYRFSFRGRMKRKLWNKGLSFEEQQKAILAFQNFDGKCQCCGSENSNGTDWHLDHKGDKFRGILCHLCNCAAAFLRDSPDICDQLKAYLVRWQKLHSELSTV